MTEKQPITKAEVMMIALVAEALEDFDVSILDTMDLPMTLKYINATLEAFGEDAGNPEVEIALLKSMFKQLTDRL